MANSQEPIALLYLEISLTLALSMPTWLQVRRTGLTTRQHMIDDVSSLCWITLLTRVLPKFRNSVINSPVRSKISSYTNTDTETQATKAKAALASVFIVLNQIKPRLSFQIPAFYGIEALFILYKNDLTSNQTRY